MSQIIVKGIPQQIAQKFQKVSFVSYKDLIQAYEEAGRVDYPVDMDIKQFYAMVKNYDGSKVA